MDFACPVCGEPLHKVDKTLKCRRNHSYDISKYHYTNLLLDNHSSSKHHGDDKLMVQARTRFLNEGHYAPLRELIVSMIRPYISSESTLLDACCGEGYYTEYIYEQTHAAVSGIDISKEALRAAAKRVPEVQYAVSSIRAIPLAKNSCDGIINLFAPYSTEEFSRILKQDGILLRAMPTEDHLFELKSAVYDHPYRNPKPIAVLKNFSVIKQERLEYMMELKSNTSIQDLFSMTPYYYKTSKQDQEKLNSIDHLTTQAGFTVILYKKQT